MGRGLGLRAGIATLVSGCVMLSHNPARACGGCFHEEKLQQSMGASVVTSHRMALSISSERTVLWDQVQYTGDPTGFAWVLPVGPGAQLELAHDAWFEALETVTATRVSSRTIICPGSSVVLQSPSSGSSSSGFGCGVRKMSTAGTGGATAAAAASTGTGTEEHQGEPNGVWVEHEAAVGPYETVTLKATDAAKLQIWLTSHGYAVPADVQPVIGEYIAAGADFIALRLAPKAGIRQMQPVRVVTPGASPILPLKMVAAGTGAHTAVTLFVIGEGRYQAKNFANATLRDSDLTWDWSARSSNLEAVRASDLDHNTFLATFAEPRAFFEPVATPFGTAVYPPFGADTLADLYLDQAAADDGKAQPCAQPATLLSQSDRVVADNPMGTAGLVTPSQIGCDGADDLGAALLGMRPSDVWVARLEANLDRTAFTKNLELQPASQDAVGNWLIAGHDANAPTCPAPVSSSPPPPKGDAGCACSAEPSDVNAVGATSAGVLALLVLRRRRRAVSVRGDERGEASRRGAGGARRGGG